MIRPVLVSLLLLAAPAAVAQNAAPAKDFIYLPPDQVPFNPPLAPGRNMR